MLKTGEDTIVNWELNHTEPTLKNIPAIVNFLGYVPEDLLPARMLGERVRRYRVIHGLTRKQMAKVLNVDEGTLQRLENRARTSNKMLEKISDFLASLD